MEMEKEKLWAEGWRGRRSSEFRVIRCVLRGGEKEGMSCRQREREKMEGKTNRKQEYERKNTLAQWNKLCIRS